MTPGDRAAALFKLANLIEAGMDHLAPIEVQNQGKTIKQARDADIPFSVDNLRFMAGAPRTPPGIAATEYPYRGPRGLRRGAIGGVRQNTPLHHPFLIWHLNVSPPPAAAE